MSKYIIRNILFILSIFSISACSLGDYRDHHMREYAKLETRASGGFLSGELLVLPDKKVLDDLVRDIDRAKTRIWLETYIWTEKSTREAILRAKSRGVDVRIILEPNVYNTPYINNDTIKILREKNISFVYSSERYTFTHAKFWMIDDRVCVSTGNWSYTTFTKNREFIYCTRDPYIMSDLESLFLSDFRGEKPLFLSGGLDARIGLSPENMRTWITSNISGAKKDIIIFNQTISDPDILDLIDQKRKKGIQVGLCQSEKKEESQKNSLIRESMGPYLHAKIILIDGMTTLIGSANLTKNALDNNREIMLKIENNPSLAEQIRYIYEKDCKPQG